MQGSYWTQIKAQRVSRRRVLAATGAGGAAALILAACGDDGGDGPGKDKSGLLREAQDTTDRAQPGGVFVTTIADALNLDPIAQNSSTGFNHTMPVYSKLTKYGLGKNLKLPGPDQISGDAAESWEISPDATQITLKLRPDHKFDPRPPTNGRAMNTADVKWSWDRFATGSSFRAELINSLSDAGVVDSLSYPDNRTVVIKLAFSYGPILEFISYYPYFNIMPVEAEDRFDPRREMRGSGPFMLMEYQPSLKFEYARSPDWYVKTRPFLDGMRRQIIPDYAAALAQFETKALWTYAVRQEDILGIKQAHPEMVLQRQADEVGAPQFGFYAFSARPNSPFRDVRLRRALSMMIDRDAYIDTMHNLPAFEAAGLPVEGMWSSHMHAGQPHWIDPKNKAKELGEGAKHFQHNPEEARKLVSAAGQTSAVKDKINYRQTDARTNDILTAMMNDGGIFDLSVNVLDEPTYRDYQAAKGNFDGITPFTNGGHNEEAWFVNFLTPGGKFAVSTQPFPQITDKIVRTRRELDSNRRDDLVKELQRDLAMDMTVMLLPGYAIGFDLHWPWLKNYGTFTSGDITATWSSSRSYTEYWYDKSAQL